MHFNLQHIKYCYFIWEHTVPDGFSGWNCIIANKNNYHVRIYFLDCFVFLSFSCRYVMNSFSSPFFFTHNRNNNKNENGKQTRARVCDCILRHFVCNSNEISIPFPNYKCVLRIDLWIFTLFHWFPWYLPIKWKTKTDDYCYSILNGTRFTLQPDIFRMEIYVIEIMATNFYFTNWQLILDTLHGEI